MAFTKLRNPFRLLGAYSEEQKIKDLRDLVNDLNAQLADIDSTLSPIDGALTTIDAALLAQQTAINALIGGSLPKTRPRFKVLGAGPGLTAADTLILLPTEVYDTGNDYNVGTGRFTVSQGGHYDINYKGLNMSAAPHLVRLLKNGAEQDRSYTAAVGFSMAFLHFSGTCVPGDYFQVESLAGFGVWNGTNYNQFWGSLEG